MNLLTAQNLKKSYKGKEVLNCNLSLPVGKVIALVGPNGAGKSTLLNIAAGLVAPTSGSLKMFNSFDPGSDEIRSRVAFVAQDVSLHDSLTVAEMIKVSGCLNRSFTADLARQRIADLGIGLKMKVKELSGGQRAQVSLSLALAKNPDALLLDEPTAALDPLASHEFLASVMQTVAETEISVIFSSHSMSDLARVSDFVTLLAHGQLQLNTDIDNVLSSHWLVRSTVSEINAVDDADIIDIDTNAVVGFHLIRSEDESKLRSFEISKPSLEQIVLAYLRNSRSHDLKQVGEVK